MAQFRAVSASKAYHERGVITLAAGDSTVVRAHDMLQLTVIAEAGATVTVSRVDTLEAAAHTTGTQNSFTVAAATKTTTVVDWPYYRVSTAGGTARIAVL